MAKKIVTAKHLSGNKEINNIITLSCSISHELKNYLAAINICAELSESKLRNIRQKIKEANYLICNLQFQKYLIY